MIDVYHCRKCSRLLRYEGVISIGGYELPFFQCEDCIVKKTIFGPGTDQFEVAYTFCVDSAGRCVKPVERLGEGGDEPDFSDYSEPGPSLNYSTRSAIKEQSSVRATEKVRGLIVEATSGASRQARFSAAKLSSLECSPPPSDKAFRKFDDVPGNDENAESNHACVKQLCELLKRPAAHGTHANKILRG